MHGNSWEKWIFRYDKSLNRFTCQNMESLVFHNLPVVRDVVLDLELYLRRLSVRDDSFPKTIKNDTYRNIAKEIINGSDQEVWIRKGKWGKTVLTIKESTLDDYLKSTKTFKEFCDEIEL